jgi:CheY-like chemotaxis protein
MMRIGTEFTIFLPASDKKISEDTPISESPLHGKGKILIMDDDEMLRNVAGAMLIALGYEVGYATDGSEALTVYTAARDEARPFDVVIMDLTVPGGMGGKEAIQKLRTLDPCVKAIVSSGYSQDAIMANYRDYGFVAVITKPYKITDLGAILNEALNSTPP